MTGTRNTHRIRCINHCRGEARYTANVNKKASFGVLPSLVLNGKGNQKQLGIARRCQAKKPYKSKGTELQKYHAFEDMFSTAFLLDHTGRSTV